MPARLSDLPAWPPIEPTPSLWVLPDPADLPAGVGEVVAVGGDLSPGTLLSGYRLGLFPMPDEGDLVWYSPDPRGVLPCGRFRVTRSLRRSARDLTVSVDQDFGGVVAACADPSRPGAWISPEYARSYRILHRLGWAHSVEVWQGNTLVGGVFGIQIGGWFAGESMFHHCTDASKVALWHLSTVLGEEAVMDVQWSTPHLSSLGVREIPRRDYLAITASHRQLPARITGPMPRTSLVGLNR